MPAERKMPDAQTLRRWLEDEGLTRKQVADRIEETTGWRPSSLSSISMAAARAGMASRRNRWDDMLPWRVKADHLDLKEALLLRKLGRRKAGLKNDARSNRWLDGWLAEMEANGRPVVLYVPDALDQEDVFSYVPRVPEDGDGPYDVIRRPAVQEALDARTRASSGKIPRHGPPELC